MAKIKKSEYIIIFKKIIRLLLRETCWGKGSMYLDNIKKSGFKDKEIPLVGDVINGLVKQNLVMKKKHKHGWKYFLNIKIPLMFHKWFKCNKHSAWNLDMLKNYQSISGIL